jgi:hypothetical protein
MTQDAPPGCELPPQASEHLQTEVPQPDASRTDTACGARPFDKDRPATFPQTQLTCPPVPRWHGGLPYRTMFRDTVCRAICVTANRPTRGVVSVYEPLGLCKPMERKISEIISLDSTTPRSSLKLLIYRQLPKTQLRESRQIRHLPEMTVSSNRRTSRRRKWPAFITPAKAVIVRSSPLKQRGAVAPNQSAATRLLRRESLRAAVFL